jgi:hypothetical protein
MTSSPATDRPPEPPFDAAVAEELRRALDEVMLRHPEVKNLAAVVCWHGNLNDAAISHAVWVDAAGGPVATADGVLGAAHQTLRLLDHQLGRALEVAHRLRQDVVADHAERKRLDAELQTKRATLERLQGEIAAAAAAGPGPGGP